MLFRRKIPPQCALCERAMVLEGQDMLCRRYGVVHREYKCRRFVYDPLKRKPGRTPPISSGGRTYSLEAESSSED